MSEDVRRPVLSVIGTGYLGATHAVCMAELGYEVIGVDIDKAKIDALNAGEVPFFEPGLDVLLKKAVDSGRLRFTTSYAEAADADVHFICVGTPQQRGSDAADLRYVESAFAALAPHLHRRCLVVGKSTVPAGTAARMAAVLRREAPAGELAELAWNPEFLREGYAVQDTLEPDRLVFGVSSDWGEQQLRAAFAPIIERGTPVVVSDYATAELVKMAANAFLATKISFINAMAEVCESTGADVSKLSEALGYDERIGKRFLHPGLGFGGGCLPKDIRAFMARAEELGVVQAVAFLREVDAINLRRRARMVDLTDEALGGVLDGQRIAVWGAAFKPNSDDIRDSPALAVATTLQERGADVVVYDPEAMPNAKATYPHLRFADSAEGAAHDADVVVHLTEWPEFRDIDPEALAATVRGKRIVDGRNVLDADRWRAAGWRYRALGRPH